MKIRQLNEQLTIIDLRDKQQEVKYSYQQIDSLNEENRRLGYNHKQQRLSHEDMLKQVNKNKQEIAKIEKHIKQLEIEIQEIKQQLVQKLHFTPDNLLVSQEQLDNVLNIVNEMVEQYNKDELCLSYPVDVHCTKDTITVTILPLEDKSYTFKGFKETKFSHKITLEKKI